MIQHYTPPRTVSLRGALFALLAIAATALLAAPIYAWATAYIPFVYVNFFLTLGFGGLTGFAIIHALRLGRFHNGALSVVTTVLGAFVVYWAHWAFWMGALSFRGDGDLGFFGVFAPGELLSTMGGVLEHGTWSVRSSDPVSGIPLLAVWVIEAVLFFGAAGLAALAFVGSGTYCARCDTWAIAAPATRVQFDPSGELSRRASAGAWSSLHGAPPASAGERAWHEILVARCPACAETTTLSWIDVLVATDDKGNDREDRKTVVDRALVQRSEADALAAP